MIYAIGNFISPSKLLKAQSYDLLSHLIANLKIDPSKAQPLGLANGESIKNKYRHLLHANLLFTCSQGK
jgi:hypothetical protein